jgi:hypothetical protein
MSLFDRFRYAVAGLRRRPGTTLVHVGRSEPLPRPRPRPLGRGPAHDKAIYRDQVNPWRHGTPDPPPPSLDLADLREELYAPRTYWWEQRDQSSHRPAGNVAP